MLYVRPESSVGGLVDFIYIYKHFAVGRIIRICGFHIIPRYLLYIGFIVGSFSGIFGFIALF